MGTSNVELRTSVYASNFRPIALKLRQNTFQTVCNKKNVGQKFGAKHFGSGVRFSSFSIDFGGARLFLTSKSSSSRFFAVDGQIFRSVRPLGLIFGFSTVHTSTCDGNWGIQIRQRLLNRQCWRNGGSMVAQMSQSGGEQRTQKGLRRKLNFQQLPGPRPRGRVGKGINPFPGTGLGG